MVTVYHRDDAGAPALVYSTAANAVAQFTALKAVLIACLVSGYGAKPAAGWELIAEGVNYIVLRNGTHSGYVCLSGSTAWLTIQVADTFSAVVSDLMTGGGVKTGIAVNNSVPHRISMATFAYSSTATCWTVVADSRTFVITSSGYTSSTPVELSTSNPNTRTLYVGEDTKGFFVAMGGANTSSTSGPDWFSGKLAGMGFTALRYPATGLLVDQGSIAITTPGLEPLSAASIDGEMPLLPYIDLASVTWYGNMSAAGKLRGVVIPHQLSSVGYASWAVKALGLSGMTVRNSNTPINLGDGHSYFIGLKYYMNFTFLITDNPEFW